MRDFPFYKPSQSDTASTVAEGYDNNFKALDAAVTDLETEASDQSRQLGALRDDVALKAYTTEVDAKDTATLTTSKAYADQLIEALRESAPETLDTLRKLAAALGDDPNFSATVMQMIGERVTTEALAAALAGAIIGKGWDSDLNTNSVGTGFQRSSEGSGVVGPYLTFGFANYIAQIAVGYTDYQGMANQLKYRVRNGDTGTWSEWKTIWNSGNFNPGECLKLLGMRVDISEPMIGTGFQYDTGGSGTCGPFISGGHPLYPLQLVCGYWGGNGGAHNLKFRTYNGDTGKWNQWYTVYSTGNLPPAYHAQIDPNGNIVGQVGDWIQSAVWADNGNGFRCDITPKVAVNAITAQITKVAFAGNTFTGCAPVVYDELIDGKITVLIPNATGAGYKTWFNISIQGA